MTDIKDFLQKQTSKNGDINLYDHLTNVLGKILLSNPKNAYDAFENLSHEVKDSGYNYKDHAAFEPLPKMRENYQEIAGWAENAFKLLNKMTNEEGEDLGPCGYVPNLIEEMRKFEWAGVHFGENETYLLQRSLTKLSHETKAKSIRFWGKILGSQEDYYIAEVDLEANAPENVEPDPEGVFFEPRGSPGVNQYNYYVSNSVTGEWKPLPVLTPEQLIKARKVKHIFTGNLDADIITNPPYKWKERHLLRAQIARISHTTSIIPKGLFKINTDSDEPTPEELDNAREIIEEEEPKQATVEELASLANWCHYAPNILKEGRTTYSDPPEDLEEEKREAWEAERKKRDPYERRLKPLNLDKAVPGYKYAWTVKFTGDTITYDTLTFNHEKANYGVVVVKSLVWPGAITIAYGKKWQSIYVGYGFKASVKPYFPILVQGVLNEPADAPEQNEPQGEQEKPAEPEDNNADQNKDPEEDN